MMIQILLGIVLALSQVVAFAPQYVHRRHQRTSHLALAVMPPPLPPAATIAVDVASYIPTSSSQIQAGINSYLEQATAPAVKTSTVTLSLQERKPPTAEEIAAKKLNFNLWFWGGGIVAPFIATIYYFGFKFWEK